MAVNTIHKSQMIRFHLLFSILIHFYWCSDSDQKQEKNTQKLTKKVWIFVNLLKNIRLWQRLFLRNILRNLGNSFLRNFWKIWEIWEFFFEKFLRNLRTVSEFSEIIENFEKFCFWEIWEIFEKSFSQNSPWALIYSLVLIIICHLDTLDNKHLRQWTS